MKVDKNILYAEDDEGVRNFVLYLLKDLSEINPEIFNDAASLEKRLQQGAEGIDLVLTDNKIPCIDGKDIIKKYVRLPDFEKNSFYTLLWRIF